MTWSASDLQVASGVALTQPYGLVLETTQSNVFVNIRSLSDEELAVRVQAGDTEPFGSLVDRYEAKLKRYGRKFFSRPEDIEDIVQDIFENSFRNIRSFDASRKFSPWIFRVAHNAFVNALRKKKLSPMISFDFDAILSHAEDVAPVDAEREHREIRELIERGLERLNSSQREILALHYLEEFSYQEIADILHVPTGTVGVRLLRARDALRKIYEHLDVHHD